MNYWLLADTHFGHTKLQELEGRPVDAETKILKGLHCVPPWDVLIHLGDFSFTNDGDSCDKFFSNIESNAKVLLIRGNHDKHSVEWYTSRGFNIVLDRADINMYGKRIAFTHEPLPWNDYSYDINIHGHLHRNNHRNIQTSSRHICICTEAPWSPVTLKRVIEQWQFNR